MEPKSVFLIIFAVVSVVYLSTLFFKRGRLQAILKGCLVPLILAIYLFGADRILVPMVLALAFGWAGDVFLLKITVIRRFRLGLACFLIGHICYIVVMFNYTRPFNIPVLAGSIAAAAALGYFLFKIVKPGKEMKIPVIAYEVIIMIMAISAIQLFLVQDISFGLFVLAGSILFVISDSLLATNTFGKESRIRYFFVMLTYISAQFLITQGFCAPGI